MGRVAAGRVAAWRGVAVLLAAMLLSGCVSFSQLHTPYESLLRKQDYDAALKALERDYIGWNSRALYYLDKGMLLRMKGDLIASNEAFEQAKRIMEELATVSVTEQVSATAVNDAMRRYAGAPYERLLAHVYKALNYLQLNDPDGARVEVLQLDVLLKALDNPSGSAMARYFSGLVFEADGQWSDALIAYRKAYEAYRRENQPVPPMLQDDLLRLTRRQGLHDEYRRFAESFGREAADEIRQGDGELVFVLHSGLIPRKQEQSIMVQNPTSGLMVRVSTPFYERRWPAVSGATLSVGAHRYPVEPVAELGQSAREALDRVLPGIVARAAARAAVKSATSRAVAQKNGELAGLVVNLMGVITEQADVRGWYTLPQVIMVAKVRMPPGEYPVSVQLSGQPPREYPTVQVAPGKTRVISLHWPVIGAIQRR